MNDNTSTAAPKRKPHSTTSLGNHTHPRSSAARCCRHRKSHKRCPRRRTEEGEASGGIILFKAPRGGHPGYVSGIVRNPEWLESKPSSWVSQRDDWSHQVERSLNARLGSGFHSTGNKRQQEKQTLQPTRLQSGLGGTEQPLCRALQQGQADWSSAYSPAGSWGDTPRRQEYPYFGP